MKMRKFSSFLAAAVTMLAALSCNKEIANVEPIAPESDAVVFTAYTDGADTKTGFNENKPVWKSGDRIWILNADEENPGWKKAYYTTDDNATIATFTEEDDSYPLEGTQYFAVYPAGAADHATWEGEDVMGVTLTPNQTATPESYDPAAHIAVAKSQNTSLSFRNAVSLFEFTVKNEGVKSVTIYSNTGEALTGSCNISSEGVITPWTGEGEANSWVELSAGDGTFEQDKAYYIAVFPNTLESGFTVEFSFGDDKLEVKSYDNPLTIGRNKILGLGELEYVAPEVVPSDYGLVGSFQGWDPANKTEMVEDEDGWIVTKNIELYKDDELKFVKGTTWDVSYGAKDAVLVANNDEKYILVNGGQNIKVSQNGKHDIYFNPTTLAFKYSCVEEYTDLQVNITINNNAKWNPLYIHLQHNEEVIANNVLVSGNVFTVDGKYIGESLSYYFTSGSKMSEEANVRITRDGATVTLEEKVIKFTFQLDTDNAKQWWGDKTYMYIWESGTSADNSWPGVEMTSDGNYTWHLNLPYELAGKTIKYIINNGNGWQSPDQMNFTINEAGHTIKGSSIGII